MPFKQNIAALAKKNPELAEIVTNAPLTGRYKMMPSQRKDGALTLLDLKFNRNYYNSIDPILAAKTEVDNKKILLPNLVVILGFGAGYHTRAYLAKYPNSSILIFEKDPELLKTVLSSVNVKDILSAPNLQIVGGKDARFIYPETFNFFNMSQNLGLLKSVNFIETMAAIASDKDYYVHCIKTVREAIAGVLNLYGNDPYDSLLGIKYTLRNISIIIDNPGIKDLEGVFKGKPGVVVATGPSLNKNVKLLEDIYNKAVIIGVDASAQVLKKQGLKPAHMVTSLERVIETARLFEGLTPEDVIDSFHAACPVVVPENYANFPGEKIVVYRNFATFKWLDIPKGILDIGPSSANMAFKILEFMGCDPIVIIGQDLAFGEDDKSHAEGFYYGETFETGKATANVVAVEGNYVPAIKTTPTWFSFLKHYERDVSTYKGRVINATEGGAKIHGTEIMSFAEAIEKYIQTDINPINTIRKYLKYTPQKTKEKQVDAVLKKLSHALEYGTQIIDESKRGVDLCIEYEKLVAENREENREKTDKLVKDIVDIHQIFGRQDFYLIFMHYVQSYFIKALMDLNGYRFSIAPSEELNDLLASKYKEFYSVMALLIEKLNDEFKASIKLLEDFKVELQSKK